MASRTTSGVATSGATGAPTSTATESWAPVSSGSATARRTSLAPPAQRQHPGLLGEVDGDPLHQRRVEGLGVDALQPGQVELEGQGPLHVGLARPPSC